MNQALWIAKTGLDAQQTRMSVISNNLANVNTTGFKQDRAVFEDLLYQTIRQPGAQTTTDNQLPSGLMIGTGVRTVATEKLHTQGNIIQTDNALDVAIDGRGYFQILMPDGDLAYTRDGTFQINSDGDMVMSNGYLLDPGINIPDDVQSITIGADGTVSVTQPGDNEPTVIGEIELADFVNPAGLQPVGENLFKETGASGVPIVGTPTLDGLGRVIGGALETSNVNVVTELINMIETQRAYEMNSKAISTADQMLQYASQNL
ncbi:MULTISPECIES: flagellar basal-body rod protein FlgG [unclassified Methylophaga]|jgi:flagellar basal-body rod protein FlgG|uniref:flagellar basal-body rod protein FlgG n=1 Tax=unclassified Methylophaga TaxID=2629249 RepID=UPI000C923061|nr:MULTISPECIES: flagellar basal-body rod protein FlgG [unclassified Methylophaga]MAP26635.1 flagellar basal-body rod protein FlgG [Methylophaga sp.]HBX59771.1 flagellar basal-body rod protein FlgG [Methylophaga sp.]HCN99801.1 flagellar basal-body rod protein FlgG [Methylophaga sp.]|tara:strand:+ start:44029 stop:44814 length:786 start_codon:yes stop_codon:yes gene_type:complete